MDVIYDNMVIFNSLFKVVVVFGCDVSRVKVYGLGF